MSVSKIDEFADQFGPLAARPDWIVQRGPSSAELGVHEEGLARFRKQEALVAHHGESRIAALLGANDPHGIIQIVGRRLLETSGGRTQQLPERECSGKE